MTTPLTDLITRAEWPDPVVGPDVVARWPEGGPEALLALGLLAEAPLAAAVRCDACGTDHVEPVEWMDDPGGGRRAFVLCPDAGAVRVDPAVLRRWVVRLPDLARVVAAAVGAAGGFAEPVPGRVWRLGSVRAAGRVWVTFLAVGLAREDGPGVVALAPELRTANALVLVPLTIPPPGVWLADRTPVVVPLADLLSLGPSGLLADRLVLESALGPVTAPPIVGTPAVTLPTETTWEQVSLVVEDHHLTVRVGDVGRRLGFAEAGFEDRRKKGVPDARWELLSLLARFGGLLEPCDRIRTKAGKLKQAVSDLRGRLGALLGIYDDPFHPTPKGGAYRTRFAIRSGGGSEFPTPPGTTWEGITLAPAGPRLLRVTIATTAGGAAFVPADDPAAGGRWEATTEAGKRQGRYTLSDLGLARPDGRPDAAGEALLAVLRSGGRVSRPSNDPAMLRLGAALSRFFSIDDPPFEFCQRGRAWLARFVVGSAGPEPRR
jgi:hypothetical protein